MTTTMEQKQLLMIDPPNELRFCGPFTRPVVTVMKLSNPQDHTVLFKIKTTAPKRYCVRPNFGSIAPRSYAKVEICLQPFVYDANEKNKHKFMVQCLLVPGAEQMLTDDWNSLWKDSAEKNLLMDAKLKCVFEMPAISTNADTSGSGASTELIKETSTQPLGEEKILNLQTSDQVESLRAEIKQKRDDIVELQKENINLKEQVVRLRCLPPKSQMDELYSPMMAERQTPMFYIAISIAAAIFGLLLGKYLL